ncbi:phytoene/squalene synthetase [Arthrobacter stackebrandtii]|uniref:Phytoene/squalene synthetase n=1 Tax=Arthrobacter stackebrandtii TaxID=272161 RepID=A0ABS4YZJ9_9MICC|nr:phytoene/squalene synthase family protein [Arthrobacter stackebrandtii]MBP2414212.1 phytoene/squalene synthetase [Arthrobacter stackebrandtii]
MERYSATASSSARVVIKKYSTSFSLACRMLDKQSRTHIENVYALVRLVDEVVDGVAREAGLSDQATAQALDRLEAETEAALRSGYSTNMIVHAFACTARLSNIGTDLTRPFFTSMRNDLSISNHDEASLDQYIFGSAEVVGLMCLRIFRCAPDSPTGHEAEAESAARRLGAAFQKVNFLRDLAVDTSELGRCYFPGLDPSGFSDDHKNELVREIREDLDAAARGIAHLPPRAALAVILAHRLFAELNRQLERTTAAELRLHRVSVSSGRKATIALQTLLPYAFKRPRPMTRPQHEESQK